ncbi:MAG: hypothetical protein WCW68_00280 [Methanothrix sp.]
MWERYLSPGELLPGRDLLDSGLFCQAVYRPELRSGKSHTWPRPADAPDSLLCGQTTES